MEIINWSLLKNPLNWFIVTLMVVIAAMGFDIVLREFRNRSNTGE